MKIFIHIRPVAFVAATTFADSQERADKTEYQEKTIDIGSEGNSISRTANKISIVALVLSGIAILISIASFLLSLLGNPFAI